MKRGWDGSSEQFGIRFSYPRVLGVYLAVNAVPDMVMLVDAADCGTMRSEMVSDNHDWFSDVVSQEGRHRILTSAVCINNIIQDRRESLAAQMRKSAGLGGRFLLIQPSPMAGLVGTDYRAIYESVEEHVPQQLLLLSQVESLGDWTAGYADVLEALARRLDLPSGQTDADKVAVVGHLWDRHEADQEANLEVLTEMVAGLGLELVSVWLSGSDTLQLERVKEAGTIVALPYAGAAAAVISARTGARVLQAELPVGPEATATWVRNLGETCAREAQAEEWLATNGTRCYRRLSKAVLRYFSGRRFAVCTDSYLAKAVARMLLHFGAEVPLVACCGPDPGPPLLEVEHWLVAPELKALSRLIEELVHDAGTVPVLVTNEPVANCLPTLPLAGVFLGFQSPGTHHLYPAPYLGFPGALSLADRIVHSICHRIALG